MSVHPYAVADPAAAARMLGAENERAHDQRIDGPMFKPPC